jgi:hypothetical protein
LHLPLQIQVLDKGSRQEFAFSQSQGTQSLKLPAGVYAMRIWFDHNQDHLWQQGELCDWLEILQLQSGDTLELEPQLSPNCH